MKLPGIGTTAGEIGRAREIVGILVKYGFSEWISQNGFGRYFVPRKQLARIGRYTRWERIRMAVEELGPTFIKFGQILADRPDVLPKELQTEFRKLQDEADPMADEIAIREVERELGSPLAAVFSGFDRQHLASASVAQTYRAVLLNGEEVCVKVQRPDISRKINLDLSLMKFFAARAQKNNPEMEAINVTGLVNEFGRTINRELDFRHEAAGMIRFRHNFEGDNDIYVPKVYMEFTTGKVLVEEFIHGIKVSELDKLLERGTDLPGLARKGLRLVFEQIFTHGYFHADPHPGNILIREGDQVVFIDYGMMGTLRQEHLQFLGKYVLGYLKRDARQITDALLLLSGQRSFSQLKDLEFQVNEMLAHYRFLHVDEMDFGKVMNESVDLIVRFGLTIPPGIYLLLKALITIERVAVTLYPDIDFALEMRPYAVELIKRQYSPKQLAQEVFDALLDYYKLLKEFPSEINEIIYKIKEGKFKTQIEIRGFEPLNEHLDKASNRVSAAIVVAALIIGAAFLSQLPQTRWLGVAVFCLSVVIGLFLLLKLFRKNRF